LYIFGIKLYANGDLIIIAESIFNIF